VVIKRKLLYNAKKPALGGDSGERRKTFRVQDESRVREWLAEGKTALNALPIQLRLRAGPADQKTHMWKREKKLRSARRDRAREGRQVAQTRLRRKYPPYPAEEPPSSTSSNWKQEYLKNQKRKRGGSEANRFRRGREESHLRHDKRRNGPPFY